MVFRELLVAGAIVGAASHKLLNSLDNDLKLAEEDYDDIPRRSLLSMLVHCTYFRDLSKLEVAAAWILDYDNERAMMYGKMHWEQYPCEASESRLKDLGLAFLLRKASHRNRNAPGLAIVLRGTIPTNRGDLEEDLRIGLEWLNRSDRVLCTVRLILQVVKKFRSEYPRERIRMAGHSLGAAIALIVGGYLHSTHNIDIDTHLFNPPLLTLVDVLRGRVLPRPTPPANFDHDPFKLEVNFSQLKEELVGNKVAMHDEWEQFQKLQGWIPKFYLNPGDPFCHQYISFYKDRQGQPVRSPGDVISPQGILSGLFKEDTKYLKNVVPSADLYISTWEKGNLRLAHSLRQWHKYKTGYIGLQDVYRARLLGPRRSGRQGRY